MFNAYIDFSAHCRNYIMNSTVDNAEREMGDNTCSLNFCQAGEKYIPIWADILIIQRESFFLMLPDLLLRSPWINRSIIAFSIQDVALCISAELMRDYAETMD